MDTATIFYNDEFRLSGKADCFDVRFDASILPKGSVVVGFMKWDGEKVVELLDPPHMTEAQEQSWLGVLAEARLTLR